MKFALTFGPGCLSWFDGHPVWGQNLICNKISHICSLLSQQVQFGLVNMSIK